jgi:hypothetical protein
MSAGDFFGDPKSGLSITDGGSERWVRCEKRHGVGAGPSAEIQQCFRTTHVNLRGNRRSNF